MAHPTYKDAGGLTRSIKGGGNAGNDGDPDILHRAIDTIASAASPDIGAVADAAVITDTTGSLSGKLRGLVKIFAERFPAALGQGTKAQSLSVTLASNQDALQLTAGSQSIGGVKDNGPFNAPTQTTGSSADATSTPVDLSTAPVDPAKHIVISDLVLSAAVDAVITIRETAGANLMLFHYKTAGGTVTISPRNRIVASTNKKVELISSAAGQIYTWCSWHEE